MGELHVGVTGSRNGADDLQLAALERMFRDMTMIHGSTGLVLHHGDCVGVDVLAAGIAFRLGWRVVAHPPSAQRFRGWFGGNSETCEPKPYLDRNRDIVDNSVRVFAVFGKIDVDLGVPWRRGEGGTAYTAKYAVRSGVDLVAVWPGGATTTSRGR